MESLDLLLQALSDCIRALPMTLFLSIVSVIIGICISVPLAVMLQRKTIFTPLIKAYVFFFTGSPLLVQLYIFYFGIPSIGFIQELMQQPGFEFLKDGKFYIFAALGLNTAAYTTQIFSGSIKNMDRKEVEAAYAYGMDRKQTMRRVILPSSLRRALPAYSNEVLMTIHATSLASTVTINEVTNAASLFNSTFYEPFIAYTAAGIVYLCLTFSFIYLYKRVEKRLVLASKSL